ncbi:unnamed protein product [Protopolystoma xenopodis]|uniref:Uncharacterized protein n=1 Tax=Protopolystoma xenopodis TaxID=117903 RepID=A0A3S5AQ13_9PLAT|nr:unnamed protein product [Protopolystoma xenopodis]
MSGRVRELEEERARLHSNTSQCASQLDRIKKSLFENRERVETLESENAALRKVIILNEEYHIIFIVFRY